MSKSSDGTYYLDGKKFYYKWNYRESPPTVSVYDDHDDFLGTYDNLDDFRGDFLSRTN